MQLDQEKLDGQAMRKGKDLLVRIVALLKKRAAGRDISGLSAYE